MEKLSEPVRCSGATWLPLMVMSLLVVPGAYTPRLLTWMSAPLGGGHQDSRTRIQGLGLEDKDWRTRIGGQGLEDKDWKTRIGGQGLED